jgi:hypothetical protein
MQSTSVGRKVGHVAVADEHARRHLEEAEPLRHLRVLHHAPADERDLPPELRRQAHQDLHPVDARGEGRHQQPAGRTREHLLERLDDVELRAAVAAAIDVRAVGEERQHALGAERREPVEVEVLAVERRLVDLEVAGVHDDPSGVCSASAMQSGMLCVTRMNSTSISPTARGPRLHRHGALAEVDLALLELAREQGMGERRRVHRAVDVGQHVRHRADVVFVPVRQHQRLRLSLAQVRHVGDDEVHARELRAGKHRARVDDDGRVAAGHGHHVEAELAEAAERHEFQGRSVGAGSGCRSVIVSSQRPPLRAGRATRVSRPSRGATLNSCDSRPAGRRPQSRQAAGSACS